MRRGKFVEAVQDFYADIDVDDLDKAKALYRRALGRWSGPRMRARL